METVLFCIFIALVIAFLVFAVIRFGAETYEELFLVRAKARQKRAAILTRKLKHRRQRR